MALAVIPVCLGDDAAPAAAASTASADTTFRYLTEVGRVRAQVNSDNKERIPSLFQGQDPAPLGEQAKALSGYKDSLNRLDPTDVDPDAVQFKDNFVKIVDAYKSLCSDSEELFREIKAADAAKPGAPLISPKVQLQLNDTPGAVDSLLAILDDAGKASQGTASLKPVIEKVRSDLAALRMAKAVHRDFTQKVKAEFTDRYQGTDWTDKQVLP